MFLWHGVERTHALILVHTFYTLCGLHAHVTRRVHAAGTLPFDVESPAELEPFERMYSAADAAARSTRTVTSPFKHIGVMNVFTDLQPFNRLIYAPSLALAESAMPERVRHLGDNVYVLSDTADGVS